MRQLTKKRLPCMVSKSSLIINKALKNSRMHAILDNAQNTNIAVPRNFKSFDAKRNNVKVMLNVTYTYTTPEDLKVLLITAKPEDLLNIHVDKHLIRFVETMLKFQVEFQAEEHNVEAYETSLQ